MSELRRLCDLAVRLPESRCWTVLTRHSYQEALELGCSSEWWASLAKRMAVLNLPTDEHDSIDVDSNVTEDEIGDSHFGDS
jgi:hypothetical protein